MSVFIAPKQLRTDGWTEAEHRQLVAMCCSGERLSALEMGHKLNKSRNAVISRIHRKNIFWDNSGRHGKKSSSTITGLSNPFNINPRFKAKPDPQHKTIFAPKKQAASALSSTEATWTSSKPIKLLEATNSSCRWPVAEPRSMLCCGLPVVHGSYCRDHGEVSILKKQSSGGGFSLSYI